MCTFMLPLFLQKIHLEKFMSSCSHIKGCISFRMLFTLLNDWVLSSFILKIIKVDGEGGKPLNLIVTKGGRYICLSRAWRGKRIIFNLWKEVFIFLLLLFLLCLSFSWSVSHSMTSSWISLWWTLLMTWKTHLQQSQRSYRIDGCLMASRKRYVINSGYLCVT